MSHPALYVYARIHVRRELLRRGYRLSDINKMLSGATDDVIDQAAEESSVSNVMGKLGDGTILQAILDFLKSPEGQALIAAIIKIILMIIAA